MPTFNFGFNDATTEISEGFDSYDGPLPPNGSYEGTLKVAKIVKMKKDSTKYRISLLVEINHPDFKGYPAWGGVNMTDQGQQYVNQWLRSLVDSEAEYLKIHKVFYGTKGPVTDEKKEHILKIGTVKINSPEGNIPVKVALKQRTWEGKTTAGVQAFLIGDGGGSSSDDEVVEEDSVEEPDLETDADDVDETDEDNEVVDESIFEEGEEDADE